MNALPVSYPHYPSPRTTLASTRKRVRFCCSVKPSQLWWGLLPICTINEIFRTIPPTFRRVSVCVCLVGFASLQSPWAHTLRHPCLACPSRCIDPFHPHNHCKRITIPRSAQSPCLSCFSHYTEPFHSHNRCKITTAPRLSPTLPKPHYPTLSTTFLAPLPKGAGLRQGYFLL